MQVSQPQPDRATDLAFLAFRTISVLILFSLLIFVSLHCFRCPDGLLGSTSLDICHCGLLGYTSMANAGTLTEDFNPHPSCADLTGIYRIIKDTGTHEVQGPLLENADCYPPRFDPYKENYYSPGFCPGGYTTACNDEDRVTCCPT